MTTTIHISYNYGAQTLSFEKKFFLSFTPFPGLTIEDNWKVDQEIYLGNTEYRTTFFNYRTKEGDMQVYVRENWRHGVSEKVIDEILSTMSDNGWVRTDSTDVNVLKELLRKEYD